MIAAPHTSNWDFVYSLATAEILHLKVGYLAKKELFKFPIKYFLTKTGGISVERKKHTNLVDTIVQLYQQSDELKLMIPAEGNTQKSGQMEIGFLSCCCKSTSAGFYGLPRL